MKMDYQFISIYYGKFVTSQTASFSRTDISSNRKFIIIGRINSKKIEYYVLRKKFKQHGGITAYDCSLFEL